MWDAQAATAVVVRLSLREVMVIHLDGLERLAPELAMRTCVELGHALGNQHWPALVKQGVVYVPLTVDRKVMASVMRPIASRASATSSRRAATSFLIGRRMRRGAYSGAQRGPCIRIRMRPSRAPSPTPGAPMACRRCAPILITDDERT